MEVFTAAFCFMATFPVSTINFKEKLSPGREAKGWLKTQLLYLPNPDPSFSGKCRWSVVRTRQKVVLQCSPHL